MLRPQLDNQLAITKDGIVILRVCLNLMLFYKNSHTLKKREAILDLLEEHARLTGDVYRWTQNPQTNRWIRLKDGKSDYIEPRDWLPQVEDHRWSFIYHAGEKAIDASHLEVSAYGRGSLSAENPLLASYILFQFPFAFFDAPEDFATLARAWSQRLRPDHGYAGFCLARSHGEEHGIASSYEYLLACRFPGLDIREPSFHSDRLGTGIKGADWLTILSDDYVDALGGKEIVKKDMGEMPVLEYPGGVVLQAGSGPQLGDDEQGIDIPEYRRVAAIVEPIRVKNYGGIHIGSAPTPCFSNEGYMQWLARFSPMAE